MGDVIGTWFRYDGVSSDDRAGGDESGGIEVCAPGDVSNCKFDVNIGEIHWEEYLLQIGERREDPPVGYQMVVLIYVECLVEEWETMLGLCFGYIL